MGHILGTMYSDVNQDQKIRLGGNMTQDIPDLKGPMENFGL